jgi:hypothetical protein
VTPPDVAQFQFLFRKDAAQYIQMLLMEAGLLAECDLGKKAERWMGAHHLSRTDR